MSLTLSAAAVFPLAGAANAALMSVAIGIRAAARRSRAGLYGAGFLAGAALATVVIVFDHAGVRAGGLLQFAEGVLTLTGGAMFALFVAALVDRKPHPAIMFAPAAAFAAAAWAAPALVLHQINVEVLVLVQAAFTVFAAWLAFAPAREGRLNARRQWIAKLAVGAMAAIHVAQIVRTGSDAEIVRDVVPYATATILFVVAGLVYFGAKAAALDPIFAERSSSPEAGALLACLDAIVAAPEVLRRTDISSAEVAAALEVAPDVLVKALTAERGLSFKEYMLRVRVAEAKRLLRDPSEARTSMEAIGLLAGFGSRSAFYKAFRDQTGASPAVYRAETCPGS
jgi:AraC-like DNA-binding protein